jgi:hypothetical protein
MPQQLSHFLTVDHAVDHCDQHRTFCAVRLSHKLWDESGIHRLGNRRVAAARWGCTAPIGLEIEQRRAV